MRGSNKHGLTSTDKLIASKKISMKKQVHKRRNMQKNDKTMVSTILEHLTTMQENFDKYFPLIKNEEFGLDLFLPVSPVLP